MSDQSVREIQLSGKQVVFMFMASVVLAVVIFLLGVSVGRGARTATLGASAADVGAPGDTTVPAGAPAAQAQPTPGDLTFHDRLQGQGQPAVATPSPTSSDPAAAGAGQPTTPASPPATQPPAQPPATQPPPSQPPAQPPATAAVEKPAQTTQKPALATQKPSQKPAEDKDKPPGTRAPAAGTFSVQVGAFSTKERADDVVQALKGKGFPAFVAPVQGKFFPVRVGPYADRADAERTQGRLVKEGFPAPVIR